MFRFPLSKVISKVFAITEFKSVVYANKSSDQPIVLLGCAKWCSLTFVTPFRDEGVNCVYKRLPYVFVAC